MGRGAEPTGGAVLTRTRERPVQTPRISEIEASLEALQALISDCHDAVAHAVAHAKETSAALNELRGRAGRAREQILHADDKLVVCERELELAADPEDQAYRIAHAENLVLWLRRELADRDGNTEQVQKLDAQIAELPVSSSWSFTDFDTARLRAGLPNREQDLAALKDGTEFAERADRSRRERAAQMTRKAQASTELSELDRQIAEAQTIARAASTNQHITEQELAQLEDERSALQTELRDLTVTHWVARALHDDWVPGAEDKPERSVRKLDHPEGFIAQTIANGGHWGELKFWGPDGLALGSEFVGRGTTDELRAAMSRCSLCGEEIEGRPQRIGFAGRICSREKHADEVRRAEPAGWSN